jgi:hypothetical protein
LIRIINGTTISFNTLPVTVLPTATGTISGTSTINIGQSANLSINLTGTAPWVYTVSDGVNSSNYTTSLSSITQNVSPTATTTYTLGTIRDNVCGTGTTSGSAVITVNSNTQLLACYPFNGNAQDSKGTYHGTVSGASLTTDRFGNANSAYNFNGNSYIELANPDDFRNSTYTYSAWVNANSLAGSGDFKTIIGISSGQVLGLGYLNSPVWAMTSYYNSSTPSYDIHPSTTVGADINNWHHLVIVRSLNQIKLYVDGNLVRTSTAAVNPAPPIYTHSNPSVVYKAMIGTRPDATNIQYFNGKIDDVKIYSGTLNDAQVQAIYLAEQQCPIIETGGVIVATNLSSATSCPSGIFTVNVSTNNVITNSGNPLKVELSNSSGLFTNPTQIGSGTTNNISCIIPAGTVAGNYKIRVVSGISPSQVISVNSLPIIVNPAVTATISGTTTILSGNTATLTVNFTGTSPWTYTLSGLNITATTSNPSITLSVNPTITTTYTVQSVSNTCGIGTTSGSAVVTVVTLPQLLACYKFEGNALDSKGTNHGTVYGATLTTDRFGRANNAYNFDGNSNYISIPGSQFATSQYTYSGWLNASELPAYGDIRTIFSVGNAGGDQFFMLFNTNLSTGPAWNYGSVISYGAGATPFAVSYTSVISNNWVHFAVVRSQTDRKIYINGQLSVSYTGTTAPYYSTPVIATIGSRYNNGPIHNFKGKIDDVKIYNGTLTDEEVLLLYNEEQGECSSPCSGMIYSLSSGSWNTPATWSCGRVPDFTDKVLIKAGHTIIISTNDAKAKKLVDNGQVTFANSTSKLSFGASPITPTTVTLTLQPGPNNGKDAEASSYSPNLVSAISPYTNLYAWTISGVPITKRFYLGFDISSIPTNAVVDSAFLSLSFGQTYIDNGGNYHDGHDGNNVFTINRVTSNWQENTLTWNTQPSFVATNQVVIPAYTYNRQHYPKMNVKNLVADMVANPANSFGFCMKHQDENVYRLTFFATSNEVNNPNLRPQLQVYYHLP